MATVTLQIEGMTCQHCVRAVTAALANVAGIAHASVDLDSGRATMDARDESAAHAARAAVAEAGYEVSDAH